jgi:hypothetical protein
MSRTNQVKRKEHRKEEKCDEATLVERMRAAGMSEEQIHDNLQYQRLPTKDKLRLERDAEIKKKASDAQAKFAKCITELHADQVTHLSLLTRDEAIERGKLVQYADELREKQKKFILIEPPLPDQSSSRRRPPSPPQRCAKASRKDYDMYREDDDMYFRSKPRWSTVTDSEDEFTQTFEEPSESEDGCEYADGGEYFIPRHSVKVLQRAPMLPVKERKRRGRERHRGMK